MDIATLSLDVSWANFRVIWLSLLDREQKLQKIIETHDEESDETVFALNDLAALRIYKDALKEKAEKVFHVSIFESSEFA